MKKIAIALALATAGLGSTQALAVENWVPYTDGINIGNAAGALPPPGFYFQNTFFYAPISSNDSSGHRTGTNITGFVDVPVLLWVPNYQIFGAQYAAAFVQPFDHIDSNDRVTNIGTGRTGAFESIISPVNLSWKLQNDFHVAVGLGIYIPDGTFDPHKTGGTLPSSNFWAYEPSVGISWLHDGWNASAKALIDFNGKDTLTNYQSGDVFTTDFSLTKTIGKWTFGAGGYWRYQYNNNSSGTAATQAWINSQHGNRAEEFGISPLIGYNFGPIAFDFYYERALYWKSEPAGDRFFTRTTIPLASSSPLETLK